MPIGTYEQVHGWNNNFRNIAANPLPNKFHAFNWHPHGNRPDNFNNLVVAGPYTGNRANDHQGHIVPQNILHTVLDPIANAAFANAPANIAALNIFLNANYPNMGFQHVTDYINNVLVAQGAGPHLFVEPQGQDAEDYVGGYFSVIMWNPENICRAPVDARRGGAPGNAIDLQVINYLSINDNQPGIDLSANMMHAFNNIPPAPNPAEVTAFIATMNAELANIQHHPRGYYQFSWEDAPIANVLQPGP